MGSTFRLALTRQCFAIAVTIATRLSQRLIAAIVTVALVNGSAGYLRASIVADGVNETHPPYSTNYGIGAIGWLYTPSFSYDLVGIETKFGSADLRSVTVEIYDEHPLYGGGVLLRSVDFTPLSDMFSGGEFASLSLSSGEDYFVGFRNVGGLGVNWSWNFPTEMLPAWVDRDSSGDYEESAPQAEFQSPILRFFTEPGPSFLQNLDAHHSRRLEFRLQLVGGHSAQCHRSRRHHLDESHGPRRLHAR